MAANREEKISRKRKMLKDPENDQPMTQKAEKETTGANEKEAAIEATGEIEETGETGEIEETGEKGEKEEIGIVAIINNVVTVVTEAKEQIEVTVVNANTVVSVSHTGAKTKARGTRVVEAGNRGKSRSRRSRKLTTDSYVK